MHDVWTDAVITTAIENGIPISEAPHFVKMAQLAEASAASPAFAAGVTEGLSEPKTRPMVKTEVQHPQVSEDRVLDKAAALLPFDADAFMSGFAAKCAEHRLGPEQIQQVLAVHLQKEFGDL